MHSKSIILIGLIVWFFISLAGLGFYIAFAYVREDNHLKGGHCTFDDCNSTANICGSSCSKSACNTAVCVESTMNLYLISDMNIKKNNYTVQTTLYVCDLTVLNNPPSCTKLFNGGVLPCYYDDRKASESLRLFHEYLVPDKYTSGLIVLPVMVGVAFFILVFYMFYLFC